MLQRWEHRCAGCVKQGEEAIQGPAGECTWEVDPLQMGDPGRETPHGIYYLELAGSTCDTSSGGNV